MDERNEFALVPRPPGALEKAEPGAKRILSCMVSDTLALVRKELATKPAASVAMCGFVDHWFSELVEILLQQSLPNRATPKLECFAWTTDLIEAARQSHYDLFILILNPAIYSCKEGVERRIRHEPNWDDHGDEINAYKLIADLKREFNKPIFVISNELQYSLTASTRDDLEKAGTDAIFGMPFGSEEFRSAFQRCLKIPSSQAAVEAAQPRRTRPLRIVMVNDEEGVLQSFETAIRYWFKDVTMLMFDNGAAALEELSQTDPDLLITDDRMAVMGGDELCQRLLDRKVSYPIIVYSACEPLEPEWVRALASRGLNISFLHVPCDAEGILKAIETALKIPHSILPDAQQPTKTRPPRIVILDDEEGPRQSYRILLKSWYDEVAMLIFDDSRQAWEELSHTDPDLFITDIHHPGIDGKEMLERLAKKQIKYPILVISASLSTLSAITSNSNDDTLNGWGRLLGLNISFLNKPIEVETFQTAVESALQIPTQRAL